MKLLLSLTTKLELPHPKYILNHIIYIKSREKSLDESAVRTVAVSIKEGGAQGASGYK